MREFVGIGTMTGTSMDGLDMAACKFAVSEESNSYTFDLITGGHVPYDELWRRRLENLRSQPAEIFAKTHVYFGHWLGQALQQFISENNLKPDFAAVHGQTIFHQPDKSFTSQIGDGETIAAYLACPVVTNFRNKNIALEGEGAPLITLGEQHLFTDFDLFLNLGGFSNITFKNIAYDVSPCNIVLDYFIQKLHESWLYDPEGQVAASGNLQPELLASLNELPYYHLKGPKSLGWEWVEEKILPLISRYTENYADILHTFCHHIAYQIHQAILNLQASGHQILITGGGNHNLFLMRLIKEKLDSVDISIAENIPQSWIDYKEAIVFGFLGLRVLTGKSSTLASVTGSKQDALCGAIHLPADGELSLF